MIGLSNAPRLTEKSYWRAGNVTDVAYVNIRLTLYFSLSDMLNESTSEGLSIQSKIAGLFLGDVPRAISEHCIRADAAFSAIDRMN